jgi:hypothetical protein
LLEEAQVVAVLEVVVEQEATETHIIMKPQEEAVLLNPLLQQHQPYTQ